MEHEAEKDNRKEWKDYHENGVLAAEGHYSKGERKWERGAIMMNRGGLRMRRCMSRKL